MKDIVIRGIAADGQIRAFAASTTNICEEARKRHNMSPIGAVALGRLLTGSVKIE